MIDDERRDHDDVLLLDVRRTDNRRTWTLRTNTAASRWAIRWIASHRQAPVNYGVLV